MTELFDRLAIGGKTAPNRIVRAATTESLAAPDGRPTPEMVALYGQLAAGGAGTVITGYAYPVPDGKPTECSLSICDDAFAGEYRALAGAVHAHGALAVLQLAYGGSKSRLGADDARRIAQAGPGESNAAILGPSAVEHPKTRLVPMVATPDDLANLARAFGVAAARAESCGFDGVEVHAAHGYLLSQFLDRRFNRRSDAHGGTLSGRARLCCECVGAARAATGEGFPVLVKLNACDVRDDPQGELGGLGQDECAQVAAFLVEAGASAIEVSGDWHAFSPSEANGEPFFGDFAARLADEVDVPVIATGGWRRPEIASRYLSETRIAAVGLSRPLVCEPGLPARWLSGSRLPSRCTSCNRCQTAPGIPCPLR